MLPLLNSLAMNQHNIDLNNFANLLLIAYADKKFTHEELSFLADKAIELGLSDQEIKNLLNNIENLKFITPKTQEQKEKQLTDAIYLTMIDGNINPKEYQLCLTLAKKLDLSEKYLNNLINLVKKLWQNYDSAHGK